MVDGRLRHGGCGVDFQEGQNQAETTVFKQFEMM
jgi:hypothetical protein